MISLRSLLIRGPVVLFTPPSQSFPSNFKTARILIVSYRNFHYFWLGSEESEGFFLGYIHWRQSTIRHPTRTWLAICRCTTRDFLKHIICKMIYLSKIGLQGLAHILRLTYKASILGGRGNSNLCEFVYNLIKPILWSWTFLHPWLQDIPAIRRYFFNFVSVTQVDFMPVVPILAMNFEGTVDAFLPEGFS
jgi:hypothetical protein